MEGDWSASYRISLFVSHAHSLISFSSSFFFLIYISCAKHLADSETQMFAIYISYPGNFFFFLVYILCQTVSRQ